LQFWLVYPQFKMAATICC